MATLQELLQYWRTQFNWHAQVAWLNEHFRHFKLPIGDIDLHFVHHRSDDPHAIPLLLVHGWPGSFVDFHKIIPKLQQKGGQALAAVDQRKIRLLPKLNFNFNQFRISSPKARCEQAVSISSSLGCTPSY